MGTPTEVPVPRNVKVRCVMTIPRRLTLIRRTGHNVVPVFNRQYARACRKPAPQNFPAIRIVRNRHQDLPEIGVQTVDRRAAFAYPCRIGISNVSVPIEMQHLFLFRRFLA